MEKIAAKLVENVVIQSNAIISMEHVVMYVTVVSRVTSVMRVGIVVDILVFQILCWKNCLNYYFVNQFRMHEWFLWAKLYENLWNKL